MTATSSRFEIFFWHKLWIFNILVRILTHSDPIFLGSFWSHWVCNSLTHILWSSDPQPTLDVHCCDAIFFATTACCQRLVLHPIVRKHATRPTLDDTPIHFWHFWHFRHRLSSWTKRGAVSGNTKSGQWRMAIEMERLGGQIRSFGHVDIWI